MAETDEEEEEEEALRWQATYYIQGDVGCGGQPRIRGKRDQL